MNGPVPTGGPRVRRGWPTAARKLPEVGTSHRPLWSIGLPDDFGRVELARVRWMDLQQHLVLASPADLHCTTGRQATRAACCHDRGVRDPAGVRRVRHRIPDSRLTRRSRRSGSVECLDRHDLHRTSCSFLSSCCLLGTARIGGLPSDFHLTGDGVTGKEASRRGGSDRDTFGPRGTFPIAVRTGGRQSPPDGGQNLPQDHKGPEVGSRGSGAFTLPRDFSLQSGDQWPFRTLTGGNLLDASGAQVRKVILRTYSTGNLDLLRAGPPRTGAVIAPVGTVVGRPAEHLPTDRGTA